MIAAVVGLALVINPLWTPVAAADQGLAAGGNHPEPVNVIVHTDISTKDGSLSIVERYHEAFERSITTVTFQAAGGPVIQHTADGFTGEVTSVFPRGSLTLSPAGEGRWAVTVVSPEAGTTTGFFSTTEGLASNQALGAAMARVIDRGALQAQVQLMGALEGPPTAIFGEGTNGLLACFGAVASALGAGLLMAATCGTPVVNVLACEGAVMVYLGALALVADACNVANW